MTKKLDTQSITNELAQTAFFRQNSQPAKQHAASAHPLESTNRQVPHGTETKRHVSPVPVPDPVPGGVRVGVPPSVPLIPKLKRAIRQRQPFDIYEDQYAQLKQIAEAEKGFENGRGMSQMVRTAIDNYLKDHGITKE
jgi:hypothetical protein